MARCTSSERCWRFGSSAVRRSVLYRNESLVNEADFLVLSLYWIDSSFSSPDFCDHGGNTLRLTSVQPLHLKGSQELASLVLEVKAIELELML